MFHAQCIQAYERRNSEGKRIGICGFHSLNTSSKGPSDCGLCRPRRLMSRTISRRDRSLVYCSRDFVFFGLIILRNKVSNVHIYEPTLREIVLSILRPLMIGQRRRPIILCRSCTPYYKLTQLRHSLSSPSGALTYTKIGTIQRRLAWPLRKDDTHNREANQVFLYFLGLDLLQIANINITPRYSKFGAWWFFDNSS